jgi:hypothetical protein
VNRHQKRVSIPKTKSGWRYSLLSTVIFPFGDVCEDLIEIVYKIPHQIIPTGQQQSLQSFCMIVFPGHARHLFK